MISAAAKAIEDRYANKNLKSLVEYRQDNLRHQFHIYVENRSKLIKVKNRILQKFKKIIRVIKGKK